jgi:NADPH-dependent 2,4-dienoyl-CoA reductase/sulfur reductase-like enzyme
VAVRSKRAAQTFVIVGGGAAGQIAAETLRREGYAGRIVMLSADDAPPCDRPNLSKDYLAGQAPEEWLFLRPPEFFAEKKIELVLGARVTKIDPARHEVTVEGGAVYAYDALLLATGASPVRLDVPGADLPHVHYLRSVRDSKAIVQAATKAKSAVVVGASFIGLEVAASLRERGLDVAVVAPDDKPLARVFGPEMGDLVQALHTSHGVAFHLGRKPKAVTADHVELDDGTKIAADLVVAGIGVRPNVALGEAAGLKVDRGLLVDRYLRTSVADIYAAGDVARWPDARTGELLRVEHWVVAERQGQIAARNMLGREEPCALVPFFWSRHYDHTIDYVGHAERWDDVKIDGTLDPAAPDCRVEYRRGGNLLAVATIGRSRDNLEAEKQLEA